MGTRSKATAITDDVLTEKEARFIEEYPKDFNATKAAERSGYSVKTARAIGYENLTKPHIQERLSAIIAKRAEASAIDAARILEEIDTVATSDVGELFDLTGESLRMLPMREWPQKARRAVSSIKVREYPEKLPPLTEKDFARLEAIATGKAYAFDISRAILPEDQIWMQGFVRRLRELYWEQYRILEIKLWNKTAGTEQAGKHRQMFTDKVEITGKDGEPLMQMEAARRAVALAEERGLTLVKGDGKRRAG
jgi:hypothetical protein